jgi:hypothetical protein
VSIPLLWLLLVDTAGRRHRTMTLSYDTALPIVGVGHGHLSFRIAAITITSQHCPFLFLA